VPIYNLLFMSEYLSLKFQCLNPIEPLKPDVNYMYHLYEHSLTIYFVFTYFLWFSLQTAIISLNSVNRLIFVTVKCGVFFAVRTGFLNII
jgi:hypothetical protein